jgi:hypothetical protein
MYHAAGPDPSSVTKTVATCEDRLSTQTDGRPTVLTTRTMPTHNTRAATTRRRGRRNIKWMRSRTRRDRFMSCQVKKLRSIGTVWARKVLNGTGPSRLRQVRFPAPTALPPNVGVRDAASLWQPPYGSRVAGARGHVRVQAFIVTPKRCPSSIARSGRSPKPVEFLRREPVAMED